MVTIVTSAALTSSSTITVARVACTTALSRLGCVIVTSAERFSLDICQLGSEDMATATIQSQPAARPGVVELVDTPALGAGGRKPLGVQVPPPAPGLSDLGGSGRGGSSAKRVSRRGGG